MAITAEKLLKLQQLKAGLQRAKNYTDSEVGKVKTLIGTLPEGASVTATSIKRQKALRQMRRCRLFRQP